MTRQSLQVQQTLWSANGPVPIISPASANQLEIHDCILENAAAAANVALSRKFTLNTGNFSFGQVDVSETPDFVDKTATIIAGSAVDIFSTTTNDGFLVQCSEKFNLIGLTVSQAETGSPVYAASYYNGSAYTALTSIAIPTAFTVANHNILFHMPPDWALGTTAGVGGNSSMYSIHIIASTAPSQAVKATACWLGKMLCFKTAQAQNALSSLSGGTMLREPIVLNSGEGLLPYFGTANAGNNARVFYKNRG